MAVKNVSDEFTACGTVLICNFNRKRSPIIYFLMSRQNPEEHGSLYFPVCIFCFSSKCFPSFSPLFIDPTLFRHSAPARYRSQTVLEDSGKRLQQIWTFSALLQPGLLQIPWLRVEKPLVWHKLRSVKSRAECLAHSFSY